MTCCRSYHMRVNLNKLRARVMMMTEGCSELVCLQRVTVKEKSLVKVETASDKVDVLQRARQ
jgi:hypothetical protein